jgi:hypothetical protein
MAFLTCPWCLSPQQVAEGANEYQCYTCYGEIRFFKCPHCELVQTVHKRWTAFTCEQCERKVDLPRRWGYDVSTRAALVRGTGQPYPKL